MTISLSPLLPLLSANCRLLTPLRSCERNDSAMLSPMIHMKEGNKTSASVKPFHVACSVNMYLPPPKLTKIINTMQTLKFHSLYSSTFQIESRNLYPRNVSRDLTLAFCFCTACCSSVLALVSMNVLGLPKSCQISKSVKFKGVIHVLKTFDVQAQHELIATKEIKI
jgi:hypothetical protein